MNIPRNSSRTHIKAFDIEWVETTTFTIAPPKPFRLDGILVWEPKGYLISVRISNIKELVAPLPLRIIESPFTVEQVHWLAEANRLQYTLPNYLMMMRFSSVKSNDNITLDVEGSFKHIILWGTELVL